MEEMRKSLRENIKSVDLRGEYMDVQLKTMQDKLNAKIQSTKVGCGI